MFQIYDCGWGKESPKTPNPLCCLIVSAGQEKCLVRTTNLLMFALSSYRKNSILLDIYCRQEPYRVQAQLLICVWKDKPLDIIQPDMQKAYELAQMYFLPRKNKHKKKRMSISSEGCCPILCSLLAVKHVAKYPRERSQQIELNCKNLLHLHKLAATYSSNLQLQALHSKSVQCLVMKTYLFQKYYLQPSQFTSIACC